MSENKKTINWSSNQIIKYLTYIFLVLLILHIGSTLNLYFNGDVIKRLDFNNERNFPTYFATLELLICGFLLLQISIKKFISKNKYRFHWRALSLIFFFLALDESFRIHDRINRGEAGGWVAYYLVLVAIIGVSYLFFVFSLPKKIRNLVIVAGAMYVGGAIGMEVVGVVLKDNNFGYNHVYYRICITVEESLEFVGLIVFIKALLLYITTELGGLVKQYKKFDLIIKS